MYVKVRVTPGARKETFRQISEDVYEVSVREPAKQNHANKRVRELIAEHFSVSFNAVRIISGHQSPVKMISIYARD